jgi:hypothetical protein
MLTARQLMDEMRLFGRALSRYAAMLKAAGKDY